MVSIVLILSSAAVLCLSGLPAFLFPSRETAGRRLSTLLLTAGSALGLTGTAGVLGGGTGASLEIPWRLPWGSFAVALDPLSAVFLVPVCVVPALGSIYGLGYWKPADHGDGRKLGLFYGLLAGSMALVTVARDGVLFLVAWEVMALSAYFASTADDNDPEVRKAGWVYLVATHIGTLILVAMFSLAAAESGSFSLDAPLATGMSGVIFVLALLGFGFKAGIMPLHVWLPGAHANAPSHVSAVMSGVMLKMGIYGILRITTLLPVAPGWWGTVLLAAGGFTCVAGIAFAVGQSDIKKLLAYSSIENIGIICLGMGLALAGRTAERWELVVLGLGGALFHVWNHALFKPLLFFGAGAVIHAAGTRDMNRLGGLAKRMPLVAALFLTGAVAGSALPPLGAFAGEWLLYVGLFRTLDTGGVHGLSLAATAAAALAMTGALAVVCYVKLYGAVFLGLPRNDAPSHAHDAPASMSVPMAVLAFSCVAMGLVPFFAARPALLAAVSWAGTALSGSAGSVSEALAPLAPVSLAAAGLAALLLVGSLIFGLLRVRRVERTAGTWDCGYAEPTGRMQYTGSSFGQSVVHYFRFFLRPRKSRPRVNGAFPSGSRFRSGVPDTVLVRIVRPLFSFLKRHFPGIRVLQQGWTHVYVLYVAVITIILLMFGVGIQP